MTVKPNEKEPEPRGDIEVGDHLYVKHMGQPTAAIVRAQGKHGVTVEVDKKHHKIKWDGILGHKKRVQQRYAIVDKGEDGMLVDDAGGRRRYVGMPNESKDDPLIAKSHREVVLFIKADPAGRGLQKKVITDKRGVQTTKWVRVDAAGPPAQPGQHVGFENGRHKGHGEVAATGAHGVTVRDDAGGEHRVHHEKVTHHWKGDGPPDSSPHDPASQDASVSDINGVNTPEDIARSLFDTSEVEKLPARAFQPVASWDELLSKGTEGLEQFKGMLGQIAQSLSLVTGKRPQSLDHAVAEESEKAAKDGRAPVKLNEDEYMLPEHWDDNRGYLFMGPLKGEARAAQKVKNDYDGDWSKVNDMVRATIAVPMLAQIPKVLSEIRAAGMTLAQKPKNNLVKPLPGGYRDLNLIVKLPNGMNAELQVHIKPMTLAKEKGHKPYEVTRTLEGKHKGKEKHEWPADDREKHAAADAEQNRLYGSAWDKSTGRDSNLTKSFNRHTLILWKKSNKPQ